MIIKEAGTYYVFCTGRVPVGGGIIPIRSSTDMRNWNWKLSGSEKSPALTWTGTANR